MKTTLKDSDITVINLPKGFDHSGFEVETIIEWMTELNYEQDLVNLKIRIYSIKIKLVGLPECKLYEYDTNWNITNELKFNKKDILKIESLEINFEKKQIIIS